MAEYANGAESQEQLNEDMLSSMQGIYKWAADDGVLTQSLTGINLSTEAEVETNNILLNILASLKKISKNITITADSQPDTTLISSGKQVPHAEAPTAIQTNKQESQSDERTFKMIAKDLGASLINPVEGFFQELADIFPKPIKLLSEMAIHPFKLMGKSLWGGAKGMLGFGAKKELEADDEPIGEIEDTPLDDTDSQSNFLDAEGNALLDNEGNALDISSTGGILLEDAGVSGDILSTLQSTNTFVGQIYNWLVAEGKERDRKDALSDADITDDGDKIAGAGGLLGFGGGRKGDDKDEGGNLLDTLGDVAPWVARASPLALLSSKVRSLGSRGINAVRGLGSRGINAIRGRGLNAAGSLIHTRGPLKGQIIKTAQTMAKTTAAVSSSSASAAGGAGRFAHLTKYPKLLKAAKRIPLLGPILSGGLAIKLLMSDASHEEKVKGIGGLIGGGLGAWGFGTIGAAIGSVFPGPGTALGGILGSLGGWFGGEWMGSKLAGFLMGDESPEDMVEKPNIPGGAVDDKMPSTLESVKPGLEKKVEQLYPTDDTTQTQKQAVKSTKKVDFFDKDWMGWSEIDREKVDLVSTHQLKMLLQAERDDIRPEDIKFIEDTIKARYVQSMEVDASVGDSIDMPTTLQDSVDTNLTKSLDDGVPLTDKGEVLKFEDWLVNDKTTEKLLAAPIGVTAEDLYADYVDEVYSKKKTDSTMPATLQDSVPKWTNSQGNTLVSWEDYKKEHGDDASYGDWQAYNFPLGQQSERVQMSDGTYMNKITNQGDYRNRLAAKIEDGGMMWAGGNVELSREYRDLKTDEEKLKWIDEHKDQAIGMNKWEAIHGITPDLFLNNAWVEQMESEKLRILSKPLPNVDSRDVANRLQVTEEAQTQSSAPVVISDSSNKSTVVNNSTTTMALSVDSQDMVAAKLNFLLPGISYSH